MAKESAKEKMIESALDLMQGQGYASTSVDQICQHAGVSKGSFYHYFKSKEDLGLTALRQYYVNGVEIVMGGAFAELEDPLERALGFMDHIAAIAAERWERGCLLGSFATEMAEVHPKLRDEVARLFTEIEENLADLLAPFASGETDVALRASALELGRYFLVALEGSIVMSRAYNDPQYIPKGMQLFRKHLESVAV